MPPDPSSSWAAASGCPASASGCPSPEIDAAIGPRDWADRGAPGGDTCIGQFENEWDGRSARLPLYGFTGPIPEAQWPQVADILSTVLRDYGFSTEGLLIINRPGNHELNAIEGATGATFEFGSGRNTVLGLSTGCHLPAAKKPAT